MEAVEDLRGEGFGGKGEEGHFAHLEGLWRLRYTTSRDIVPLLQLSAAVDDAEAEADRGSSLPLGPLAGLVGALGPRIGDIYQARCCPCPRARMHACLHARMSACMHA